MGKDKLIEIEKPFFADFVMDNGKGILFQDGMYYHFSEVIRLIKLWDGKKAKNEESNCNITQVVPRFSSFEDALGYINRTNFRYKDGDNFVNQLNEEQLIRFATLLSELP